MKLEPLRSVRGDAVVDDDPAWARAPFICGVQPAAYSRLNTYLHGDAARDDVFDVCDWLRMCRDGLYLAAFDDVHGNGLILLPPWGAPQGDSQRDMGAGRKESVWFNGYAAALLLARDRWQARAVSINHPTETGWDNEAVSAVVAAVAHVGRASAGMLQRARWHQPGCVPTVDQVIQAEAGLRALEQTDRYTTPGLPTVHQLDISVYRRLQEHGLRLFEAKNLGVGPASPFFLDQFNRYKQLLAEGDVADD